MPSTDTQAAQRRVEAARYVLLRRLAPAMRDRMLARLEPIGMMAQVIERRLRQPACELARVESDLGKVQGFARDAVGVNLDVVDWLAPQSGAAARIGLDAGVQECVALLRGHFGFGGFRLQHLATGAALEVSRVALRTLLPAVLFALADEPGAPALLGVTAEDSGLVTVRAEAGAASPVPFASYRPLRWEEVQALAQAEDVALQREGGTVTLRLAA